MDFVNSKLLWGGLAAAGVAVPIIIHLLNRYRHRQIDWAAMELLKKAMTIRSRQVRIEDILLMILRCAAILLIALALARPTLRGASASWLGGQQQVAAVIAIDASYSMGQKEVTGRFDRAKARVEEIFGTLQSGDPVTIVMMGSRPHFLLRNVAYEKDRFDKLLKEADILPERLNLDANLEEIAALMKGDEMKAAIRECYIVTDAQVNCFENLSPKAKMTFESLGSDGRLFFIATGADSNENVGLTRLELVSGMLRKGMTIRFMADVKNFGTRPKSNMTVSLLASEQAKDQAVAQAEVGTLAPGETRSVPLLYRCDSVGDVKLTARLSKDELLEDNTRYAVAHVREQVRVLLVEGRPADRANDADFITTALIPKQAAAKSMTVQRISAMELGQRKLSDFNVVILSNIAANIPAEHVKSLGTYVDQGGGLIIFLGDQIRDKGDAFSATFNKGKFPLLPGELHEVTTAAAKSAGWGINPGTSPHPIAQSVQPLPHEMTAAAGIRQFVRLQLGNGGSEILSIAGADAPLLAEKQVGRGSVLLCTTSADRRWGDMVLNPAYVIMLHQAVTYLTTQSWERGVLTGSPIIVPIPDAQAKVTVREPGGGESGAKVTAGEGRCTAEYDKTDTPGFYEFRANKDAPPLVVAVNIDPIESDVKVLDNEKVKASLKNLPVHLLTEGQGLSETVRQARIGRELWPYLLTLGLLTFAVETLLAWFFSRRMAVRTSGDSREDVVRRRESVLAATAN